jgi:hypothetical protein
VSPAAGSKARKKLSWKTNRQPEKFSGWRFQDKPSGRAKLELINTKDTTDTKKNHKS